MRKRSLFFLSTLALLTAASAGLAVTAHALPVADTFTRSDSTNLGTTETGGLTYQEFDNSGGFLVPADVAAIQSGRLHVAGPPAGGTDPVLVGLSGVAYDLRAALELRMLGTDYDPFAAANGALLIVRQGMDDPSASATTAGALFLSIFPDGTYSVSVITATGVGTNYDETILVDHQPIGAAFTQADVDGDGVLETNEPLSIEVQASGSTFCWFAGGQQVGRTLWLQRELIWHGNPELATNLMIGRTTLSGPAAELEFAVDNLDIDVPGDPCPAPGEHYMFYKTKIAPKTDKFTKFGPVSFSDEFDLANHDVKKVTGIGVPADKNGEGIEDATTHLLSYQVKRSKDVPKFAERTDVHIINQCNDMLLEVTKPDSLLVPAAKCIDSPPGTCADPLPAPDPETHGVDHFLCYKAKAQKKLADGTKLPKFPKNIQVDVSDQFQTRRYDLKKITKLCVPTEKFGLPTLLAGKDKGTEKSIEFSRIRNSYTHLVCYQAKIAKNRIEQNGCGPIDPSDKGTAISPKQAKHQPVAAIHVSDQFGTLQLETKKEVELCIPSRVERQLRHYANIFEYRMCNLADPNWCPNGDDFRSDLFDAMYNDISLGSQPEYKWKNGATMSSHYVPLPDPPPPPSTTTDTRYALDRCEVGLPDANGTCPDAGGRDVIRCTDGTRPVFYHRLGSGVDANHWIIKIQGGGDTCDLPRGTISATSNCPSNYMGSSRHDFSSAFGENAPTTASPGIFSTVASNAFHNFTTVRLDKCVGDRNMGTRTAHDYPYARTGAVPDGVGPVYFHGYRILLALLRQLKEDFGLGSADSILFITQSNGTNGGYIYMDRLADYVHNTLGIPADVRFLAQSYMLSSPENEYFFENGVWPASYSDIPSSLDAPGTIVAPDTDPDEPCGPGFDPAAPRYEDWILEGQVVGQGPECKVDDFRGLGAHGKAYATESYHNGTDKGQFSVWGADNGPLQNWDESCLQAHPLDHRPCRDSMHVLAHHLQTPTFLAAQIGDRKLRRANLMLWAPDARVWAPLSHRDRVIKLAEVVAGITPRAACADANPGDHAFYVDNTVDHFAVTEMSKLRRPMKANAGGAPGTYFELQDYLKTWLDPANTQTFQCLDSDPILYDVEFDPVFPVSDWPVYDPGPPPAYYIRCTNGYYGGSVLSTQVCDDPGFVDPTLNQADPRFVCESPGIP